MKKNILIIGAARTGKTTLSRKLKDELGYSIISLDDIISAFGAMPECGIKHHANNEKIAQRFSRFLKKYLIQLTKAPNFTNGVKYVIEGTYIDFEQIMPLLTQKEYQEKYAIIGLLYNDATFEEIYQKIKEFDTEEDWTYKCSDTELRNEVQLIIKRNKFFYEKFLEYKIKTYDTSKNRPEKLNNIIKDIKDTYEI